MAYGKNRSGVQPRAYFQAAGGIIMKLRHPLLAGAIDTGTTGTQIDEIDVSSCSKLADTFLTAQPSQDSAIQEVLIDGSTVTVTNRLLNGILTINAIKTSNKVAAGDFIAACQLIKSVGDTVGGTFQTIEMINGEAHIRLYYGVTVKRVPDAIHMGMGVPVYPVELWYTGYLDAIGSVDQAMKAVWAVGSDAGVQGIYTPYEVQSGSTLNNPMSADNVLGQGLAIVDDTTGDANLPVGDSDGELVDDYAYINNATQPFPGA